MARRPAIRLLVVPQRRAALEKIVLHATNLRIPIVEVEGGSLTALAGFDGHQGVALVVEPRQFASLDDVFARAAERGEPPFILVLDSLEDPHNVGTLLRSAEAAGVHGVLFPTHRQAPLSPSAVKASAGAIEHLLLAPVDDLAGALSDLHARGVRIAGAEGDAPMTARQSDLRGPLAIVVGSEGQGLGPAVRRRADLFMRIPMKGAVGSLNAAVAGSILLFEALAQRDPNAMPTVAAQPDGANGRSSTAAQRRAAREPNPTTIVEAKAAPAEGAAKKPKVAIDATASLEAPEAPIAEAEEASPPGRRARKATVAPGEGSTSSPADHPAASGATKPKPRVRKGLSTEPAEAPSTRDASVDVASATESRASAEAAQAPVESDLLPADGARKRRSRTR